MLLFLILDNYLINLTGTLSGCIKVMVVITTGMAAFLDCLQQFKEEVEKGDSGFHLPYDMEKGKIKDPSSGTRHQYFIEIFSK